jgi:ribose transport system substrate-binding protein
VPSARRRRSEDQPVHRASAITVAALVLSACGDDGKSTTTTPGGGGASPGAKGKKITLMVGVKGDPFYVSMECGAKEAAAAAGATLNVQGPDKFDATLQNPLLDAVASSKPDALLVAPNDVKASGPPLKRIQDAGTKVILVDTVVTEPSIGASRIATDNKLGGEKAAEALSKLGVKGKVLVISTDPGVSSVDARVDGFKEKAASLGLTLIGDTQYSNNQPTKAAQIISATLAKNPDLGGVFATNVFTAQGVATGVKQAGKSGTVKVVGFDAGPTRSSSSRPATCRRSSRRSRTTSASRAWSRRWPRSPVGRSRRRSRPSRSSSPRRTSTSPT